MINIETKCRDCGTPIKVNGIITTPTSLDFSQVKNTECAKCGCKWTSVHVTKGYTSMSEERLDKLRKGIEAHLDARVFPQTEETNPTITGIIQCYLLLQILDMLGNINEKIAMMKIDIQDVEQAILAQREDNHDQR